MSLALSLSTWAMRAVIAASTSARIAIAVLLSGWSLKAAVTVSRARRSSPAAVMRRTSAARCATRSTRQPAGSSLSRAIRIASPGVMPPRMAS